MTELIKTGIYPFVKTLSEPVVKNIIWENYFRTKADTKRVPCLKAAGAYELGALCMLKEFGRVQKDENTIRQCNYIIYQIFQYTPTAVIGDTIKMVVEKLQIDVTYQDYIRVLEYLKKTYGAWFLEMEFTKGIKDFDYEMAYEAFKKKTAPKLNGWSSVQEDADRLGLSIGILHPDMSVSLVVEQFFKQQSERACQRYGDYKEYSEEQLYEAYKTLAVIPCKTVLVAEMTKEMEKKLEERKKGDRDKKLERFLEYTKDKKLSGGRVTYGDNEYKVKQAENNFVSSGKFEHILLINDTSKIANAKEGMAITTEKLYYKSLFQSGEIPVLDISHFEFAGSTFSQAFFVCLKNGKKYKIPCNVGKMDQYKYLKILETLLLIIREEEVNCDFSVTESVRLEKR